MSDFVLKRIVLEFEENVNNSWDVHSVLLALILIKGRRVITLLYSVQPNPEFLLHSVPGSSSSAQPICNKSTPIRDTLQLEGILS